MPSCGEFLGNSDIRLRPNDFPTESKVFCRLMKDALSVAARHYYPRSRARFHRRILLKLADRKLVCAASKTERTLLAQGIGRAIRGVEPAATAAVIPTPTRPAIGEPGGEEDSIDLVTSYLGLALHNPIIASASPLSRDVGVIRQLEDSGIAAVVLPSLFEEQIRRDEELLEVPTSVGIESNPEAS